MPETCLYLLRHGQTDWNLRSMLQGRTDIPLNDTGRQQAEQVRKQLAAVHFDAVYSSPLCRAVETAALAAGISREEVRVDERLVEIAFGCYEGRDTHDLGPEFAPFFSDPAAYCPPQGGESLPRLVQRTGEFLRFAAQQHPGQTLLVAGHGASLHALLTAALAQPLDRFWSVSLGNCRTAVITADAAAPGGWRLTASDGEGAAEYIQKYLK